MSPAPSLRPKVAGVHIAPLEPETLARMQRAVLDIYDNRPAAITATAPVEAAGGRTAPPPPPPTPVD